MYPNIFRRYLATLTDLAVVILIIWGVIHVLGLLGYEDSLSTNALIIFVFLIYEPLLTSKAATVGQLIFRFRVREQSDYKNITLMNAYLRFLTEVVLGGWSLLKIPGNRRRQAVHDSFAGTIVLNQKHLLSTGCSVSV